MGSAPNARPKFYPRLVDTFYRSSSDEAYVENLRVSLERIPVPVHQNYLTLTGLSIGSGFVVDIQLKLKL